MDSKNYQFMVDQLEADSKQHPDLFRFKVMLISGVAYVILCLFLVSLALLLYWVFEIARHDRHYGRTIQVGLFALTLLPVFWVSLKTFFTRIEPPTGRELKPGEAERFFRILERIRRKLNGTPIHKVLLDDQYNAAICQVPRFGLFGGHRNYLIVGLPYLLATPEDEMIATLAHEYGHLAGDHGKMGAWVYRQRRTFGAIHSKVIQSAEGNWINGLMAGALNWFAPYYNAYTFVLSRQQEYEADAAASRVAGLAPNGSGLVRDDLLGRWLFEDYWPRLYAQASEQEKPRFMPYAALRTAFTACYSEWATKERLAEALKRDSGVEDTHPCLRERLEAIDAQPTLPLLPKRSAAETMFGAEIKKLIEEFDTNWWAETKTGWQSHYQRRLVINGRVTELLPRGREQLSDFELQELASLQAELGNAGEALESLACLLRRGGGPYPRAELLKGRLLLSQGDRAGLDALASARANDGNLEDECLQLGYDFLYETKGEAAADHWVRSQLGED